MDTNKTIRVVKNDTNEIKISSFGFTPLEPNGEAGRMGEYRRENRSFEKEFWLFLCTEYEPGGGLSDFIGGFSTLQEVEEYIDSFARGSNPTNRIDRELECDFQIFNSITREICLGCIRKSREPPSVNKNDCIISIGHSLRSQEYVSNSANTHFDIP